MPEEWGQILKLSGNCLRRSFDGRPVPFPLGSLGEEVLSVRFGKEVGVHMEGQASLLLGGQVGAQGAGHVAIQGERNRHCSRFLYSLRVLKEVRQFV
jgi:hypothetical protein